MLNEIQETRKRSAGCSAKVLAWLAAPDSLADICSIA
jgi:hypothetical protein